jgi:hypothetical protein
MLVALFVAIENANGKVVGEAMENDREQEIQSAYRWY